MGFADVRKIGFDTETTGTDVENDRIVTAALVFRGGGIPDITVPYLINPGIDIPTEASDIHGITTEMAQAGQDPKVALNDIADKLAAALLLNLPVIAFNLPFDWTIFDRELARNGLPSVADRLNGMPVVTLVDPIVIDRHVDRYRKGQRTLQVTAEHYGVAPQDWHTAEADALAAVQVAEALFARYPHIAAMSPGDLFAAQAAWHGRWAAGLQAHLRESGKDPEAVVDGSWPLRPTPAAVA